MMVGIADVQAACKRRCIVAGVCANSLAYEIKKKC